MLKKIWDNFEEYILIALFSFVTPLLLLQIIMRYVFKNSLSWSEELARYIFLWMIWIGSSYGVKKSRHIRIEIIKNKVSEQANYILEIVVIIISMGFCAFLVVKGSELVARIFSLKQISPALRLPMGYPYLSVPVGASLMIIRYIEKIIEITNEIRKLRLEGKVK
jgi:TRAP-type C4-dicarboxylate transport system permease small subunit